MQPWPQLRIASFFANWSSLLIYAVFVWSELANCSESNHLPKGKSFFILLLLIPKHILFEIMITHLKNCDALLALNPPHVFLFRKINLGMTSNQGRTNFFSICGETMEQSPVRYT